MMLFPLFIVAFIGVINVNAVTTQENVISTATKYSLNNLMQNLYDSAMTLLSLTGDMTDIPLSSPLMFGYTNQTGSQQQALYGAFTT
jgi:uncharacterized membrane protein YadS